MTDKIDWVNFFAKSNGWLFQAAPCPEHIDSIGSMECIYQAFKARMEAERSMIGDDPSSGKVRIELDTAEASLWLDRLGQQDIAFPLSPMLRRIKTEIEKALEHRSHND